MLEKTQGALDFFHPSGPVMVAPQGSSRINQVHAQAEVSVTIRL